MILVELIAWVVVGALSGWVASKIMKTDLEMGPVANIVAGVVGALVGGFLMRNLFGANVDPNAIDFGSILTAILGAMLVIGLYKAVSRRP